MHTLVLSWFAVVAFFENVNAVYHLWWIVNGTVACLFVDCYEEEEEEEEEEEDEDEKKRPILCGITRRQRGSALLLLLPLPCVWQKVTSLSRNSDHEQPDCTSQVNSSTTLRPPCPPCRDDDDDDEAIFKKCTIGIRVTCNCCVTKAVKGGKGCDGDACLVTTTSAKTTGACCKIGSRLMYCRNFCCSIWQAWHVLLLNLSTMSLSAWAAGKFLIESK